MKKFILLMLAMALIVSLCGCTVSQEGTDPSSEPSSSVSVAEPEPTSTPTPEPTPTQDPKTTPEYHSTMAVQERGVLTIGVSGSSKNNYIIPDDPEKYGELAGTRGGDVPEMCRRIAEELGIEAEFVEYDTLEAQLQAVTDGEVDLAADNFVITEERLAIYEMTDNFSVVKAKGDEVFLSTNPQPWLPPEEETEADPGSNSGEEEPVEPEPREMIQSEEELAHARIAVLKGSVQVMNTAKQYPEAELYEFASNDEILKALIEGQVDAGVFTAFDKAFADQIVQAILDEKVAQCGYEVAADSNNRGLILMKDNEELCQSLNEIIADLIESGWMLENYETEEAKAAERGIF